MMHSPGLLVSVRSAEEALAALNGGADVIDVKEPGRGSLGRAHDGVLRDVLRVVASRRPVSAALGELVDASPCQQTGLAFAKWGLAGAGSFDWQAALRSAMLERVAIDPHCRPVVVAYADWQLAHAPAPDTVADFACHHGAVLLVDTWSKNGKSLLDWFSPTQIAKLIRRCHEGGTPIALAGSLNLAGIGGWRDLWPDWFAVRGAACRGGQRDQVIEEERVKRLADWIHGKPR